MFSSNAESWLVQQAQYDLAHVRKDRIKLKISNRGMIRVVSPGPQFTRLIEADMGVAI